MDAAVIYYSFQGNSALAAKALADKLGARLVELKEPKARSMGPGGFMLAGFQASFGVKSKLTGQPWQEVSGCGELHLITPIWASKPVPAMNRFLSKCDFSGKTVSLYAVMADPSAQAEKAWKVMASQVEKKGGKVKVTYGLVGAGPGKGVKEELAQKIFEIGR